ncbi:hypothetical protein OJAV_G00212290 [Oryzias javanicus]|uniref:Uncharacterized protein n=1 Tax=Oryzias javanicus TaxID=123683 RepID=A0A437C332_ORYJA|nr:hypothetical protein OJAV_G00212290 [Oryzias javanicus]
MDSLYTAVMHSEHRSLWKPIDLNQRVREGSSSPLCSISLLAVVCSVGKKRLPEFGKLNLKSPPPNKKNLKFKKSGIFEGSALTCQLAVGCTSMLTDQFVLKNRVNHYSRSDVFVEERTC